MYVVAALSLPEQFSLSLHFLELVGPLVDCSSTSAINFVPIIGVSLSEPHPVVAAG